MPTECPECGAVRVRLTEVTAMDAPQDQSEWVCCDCGHIWTVPLANHTEPDLNKSGEDE